MTKSEWILHYRALREARPRGSISQEELTGALHEVYGFIWTDKQQAFINLVHRYRDKVGQRHLDQIEAWRPDARARAKVMLTNLIYSNNPFLKLLPKDVEAVGGPFVVPIVYG